MAGFGPLLTSDPSLQFCLQAARRSLGDFQTGAEVVLAFRVAPAGRTLALRRAGGVVADQPQRRAAQAGVDLSATPTTRPLLDGKLNDTCWQSKPSKLQNAAGDTGKDFADGGAFRVR